MILSVRNIQNRQTQRDGESRSVATMGWGTGRAVTAHSQGVGVTNMLDLVVMAAHLRGYTKIC